ncbi:hypothetical protein [Bacteroides sp. An19]|uniref:hypothetical protein n=1 Tax=Bacteroides sp. An19 TaxID=1965580 RepID=UPI000B374D88|nr:hypothetical protein [Bacteroides sp. An19]OUP35642.1 hypothetical protein B5F25_04335 [Bacteroides sp. An19]
MGIDIKRICSKIIQDNFDRISQYSIQLFHNDMPQWESSPPEPIGTGVLIKYEDNHFIVSAAHVLQPYATKQKRNPYREESEYDDPQEAFLSLENMGFYYNGFYYPIKEVTYTNITGEVENLIDIAVIRLEIETVEELSGKQFVDYNLIEFNHTITTQSRYFVYGYPAEWTDLKSTEIVQKPLEMITNGIDASTVEGVKFDAQYNLLIGYTPKSLVDEDGHVLDISSPNGISGCGLWYLGTDGQLKLVGIMTENKIEKEGMPFMMATQIDTVIGILKNRID